MPKVNIRTQSAKINGFYKGFVATHLINIGNELGIFEAFKNAKKGLTISNLAEILGFSELYLKIWCQTAYFFEILDFDDEDRYKFQPFLDIILGDKSNLRNVLSNFRLHINFTGEILRMTPEHYRTGKIIEHYTPQHSEIVSEAMKPVHMFLKMFFTRLPENNPIKQKLVQGIKFLDIGCGSGRFINQLAQMFKNSRFIGIDPVKHEIETARNAILKMGLEEQVSVKCLGNEELHYNNEFDLISMIFVFHEIPPEERLNALEKAFQALKKDGRLLIFDFSYPDKIEDFRKANYELGIMHQFSGICLGTIFLTPQEQNKMLTEVGFKDIQRMMFEGIEFVTAIK